MSVWLSPQQIASMRLACMPTHEVSIRRMCKKNLFVFRSKERGKGIEIALDSLPIEAQRDYYARYTPPAPTGDPIQAGLPSPADTSPAATGAGGVSSGGGLCGWRNPSLTPAPSPDGSGGGAFDPILVGQLIGTCARDDDFERVLKARDLMLLLKPLLDLPERHRGRRAMAESIAAALGKSVAQVYRLADVAREHGVMGLARIGERRDRGQARTLISGPWLAWASETLAVWPGEDLPVLAERMRQAVRSAWVGGAPSERQCWLKATAAVAKDLMEMGCPREACAALLNVPAPRRYLAAEGQHFRVAGRALRDGKSIYDKHLAPVRRTAKGLLPGDLVCGDITPLDIPVLRDDGSTAYARIIAWHDVATNWLWADLVLLDKGTGIRREHVAASYAGMCERAPFGAPRRIYLDNGSEYKWDEMLVACKRLADFTGQAFAADEATTAPAERQVIRSIPFRPRGKRIEGLFGNLSDWLGWWFGYVGGNRMTKKVATLGKGVQPAPFAAVKDWLDRTLADYHVTPQPRSEHMDGMSPQQKLTAALESGWRPWRINALTLLLAFADYHIRTIDRGTISVDGVRYTGDFLMVMEGKVQVAVPRVLNAAGVRVAYVLEGTKVLGMIEEERVYQITDQAGAKEAGRRRGVLK
ncbi:MAG: Mu transposase C-terminal domain-containing protein, partial [Thiobacillus sp.]|nr:Mu transposase C-terminal domain-containing protein [Thiobacillus sp.]